MSKLVKAYRVVSKSEPKIVSLPNYKPLLEETDTSFQAQQQQKLEQLIKDYEAELSKQKEQALKELAEWRKKEEEQFRLELDEEKRRGYQEGYQMGIEEGRSHGLDQYSQLIQNANSVLEQAYQEKMSIIQEAEPFVMDLSIEIASKIIKQELTSNKEALMPIIKDSISSVYETSSLTINVSPDDYSFVQRQREHLLAVVNGQVEVKIAPDFSIQHGGCIIHTSSGSVDARVDVQLSEIKKVLLAFQQGDRRE